MNKELPYTYNGMQVLISTGINFEPDAKFSLYYRKNTSAMKYMRGFGEYTTIEDAELAFYQQVKGNKKRFQEVFDGKG
ncbi:MAG: hypothetical protein HQL01_15625 [Nitrospirae bacterium]|nr:hypothetical protein [Nitrospirota bacterium]